MSELPIPALVAIDVEAVERHTDTGGREYWHVLYRRRTKPASDQPLWAHIVPAATFTHRVAEYGLDPGDHLALLRLVLLEPFENEHAVHLPESDLLTDTAQDARAAKLARHEQVAQRVALLSAGQLVPHATRRAEPVAGPVGALLEQVSVNGAEVGAARERLCDQRRATGQGAAGGPR